MGFLKKEQFGVSRASLSKYLGGFYFASVRETQLSKSSILCKLRFRLNIIPSHAGSPNEKELWIIS